MAGEFTGKAEGRHGDRLVLGLAGVQQGRPLGELLPPAVVEQMCITGPEEADKPNRRYRLGLDQVTTPCGTVWGHDGQVPDYNSDNYTDDTGLRTVSVLTTTVYCLASPKTDAVNQALVNAAE